MFIGLLGGSFNPIHNGHLHIAKYVCNILSLDRVIFIPTGDPPHKPANSLASAEHRMNMVTLATQSDDRFTVDNREIQSSTTSYTVDTVAQLKDEFPNETKLGFIIGLDAFLELPSWKQASHLLELCHMIVCSRPGVTFTQLQTMSLLPSTPMADLHSLDMQSSIRLDIPLPLGSSMTLLAVPPCKISASHIRHAITHHSPLTEWLPPSVESYIIDRKLYQ